MSLFRFMNYDNAMDVIQNQRLRISNPRYFNDPFDSRVAVDDNDPEVLKLINQWPRVRIPIGACGCYGNPHEREIEHYNKLIKDAVFNRDICEIEKWRVACFSKQTEWEKYILMWSLYADSHKGAMIEFCPDFEIFMSKNFELLDVEYKKERETIHYRDSLDEATIRSKRKKALTIKSQAWAYEKETRLIIPADKFDDRSSSLLFRGKTEKYDKDYLRIKHEWISKVYCGAMMTQEDFEKMKKEADKKSIDCVKLRLCAVKYELHDFGK